MDPFQALVTAIVQGLTEFLPISSSAHLIIVPWLFGWQSEALSSLQFGVALHMGTLLAVLAYFRSDWRLLLAALATSLAERKIGADPDRRLVWLIALASIPAALAGMVAESRVESIFHEPGSLRLALGIIAATMIIMALLLLLAERVGRRSLGVQEVNRGRAVSIGLAQALALLPGVSRSGSTITMGLFLGLKREAAARFSFLLATPITLGAGLKELYDLLRTPGGIPADQQIGFALGITASAITGFLCIHFLLRYLQRHSTAPFIWYRLMLGLAIVALLLSGRA